MLCFEPLLPLRVVPELIKTDLFTMLSLKIPLKNQVKRITNWSKSLSQTN